MSFAEDAGVKFYSKTMSIAENTSLSSKKALTKMGPFSLHGV